jgi:uncharacterized protein
MSRQSPVAGCQPKLLAAGLLIVIACASGYAQTPDLAYQAEFKKWQQEQIADLKENWLPLVGLFWLKEGDNSFGADPHAAISLDRKYMLPREGVFTLKDGKVEFHAAPGSHAKFGSVRVEQVLMSTSPATTLELGQLRMLVIQRAKRFGLRVKDMDSPAIRDFKGLQTYPLHKGYIVTAQFLPGNGRTMSVPNIIGDRQDVPLVGIARFRLNDQEQHLWAMDGGDGKLFIVFSDLTKKKDTYPAGRFLDAGPVSGGKVILDFNKAYSPPCAWTPYATCPLPPKENQLQIEIPAGEKYVRH